MTTKPIVVYEDQLLRVVRRPDRAGQRAYFDVEMRRKDALGAVSWGNIGGIARDDSEALGRDWIMQLLARVLDEYFPVQPPPTEGQ